jgi:hypothetical protein
MPVRFESDSQKRDTIVSNKGAIAWRQGEVSEKGGGRDDVWHVILSPYVSKSDHITVVGRRPANATIVRGPQSAYRTAQMLYGKHLSQEVRHDVGLFDVNLAPISGDQGIKLSYIHDPSISGTAKEPVSPNMRVFPLEKKGK